MVTSGVSLIKSLLVQVLIKFKESPCEVLSPAEVTLQGPLQTIGVLTLGLGGNGKDPPWKEGDTASSST